MSYGPGIEAKMPLNLWPEFFNNKTDVYIRRGHGPRSRRRVFVLSFCNTEHTYVQIAEQATIYIEYVSHMISYHL